MLNSIAMASSTRCTWSPKYARKPTKADILVVCTKNSVAGVPYAISIMHCPNDMAWCCFGKLCTICTAGVLETEG